MATRTVTCGARFSLVSSALACLVVAAPSSAQPACPRATLPAYAHNDYLNPSPLHEALSLGYAGVEADVFLVDGVLRLGHERRTAERGAAFEAQYLIQLRTLMARCGSLTDGGRPFLLNVELKEKAPAAFDTLMALLARYAELLTSHGEGPVDGGHRSPAVEVVLVGWSPATLPNPTPVPIGRQVHLRHVDGQSLNITDPSIRLISVDYGKTMGRRWVTSGRRRRWLSTIREVRAEYPAQRIRVHDVPQDERVYRELLGAGVDLIGTTALARTARLLGAIMSPGRDP